MSSVFCTGTPICPTARRGRWLEAPPSGESKITRSSRVPADSDACTPLRRKRAGPSSLSLAALPCRLLGERHAGEPPPQRPAQQLLRFQHARRGKKKWSPTRSNGAATRRIRDKLLGNPGAVAGAAAPVVGSPMGRHRSAAAFSFFHFCGGRRIGGGIRHRHRPPLSTGNGIAGYCAGRPGPACAGARMPSGIGRRPTTWPRDPLQKWYRGYCDQKGLLNGRVRPPRASAACR